MMPARSAQTAACPLRGRHIVITRPLAQNEALARALEQAGASPVVFPVLEITDVPDPSPVLAEADRLERYALAIFVSPNAAEKALSLILARRQWPGSVRAATVGVSSERTLARFGLQNVIAPRERFDSEALLELPELQADAIGGRDIVIFRGDGGRELLGDTLSERGARVAYVTCYHRGKPDADPRALFALWARGSLDAVTVTSSEGLRNLREMLGTRGWSYLADTPLFVPHARIAEQAKALGLERVVLTGPGDAGLVEGMFEYFAGMETRPRGD